jgi:hypothetical protein
LESIPSVINNLSTFFSEGGHRGYKFLGFMAEYNRGRDKLFFLNGYGIGESRLLCKIHSALNPFRGTGAGLRAIGIT